MSWSPSSLKVKKVTPSAASNAESDVTITVDGAGFEKGLVMALVLDPTQPGGIIPINEISQDSAAAYTRVTGRISPLLKNSGRYTLVAWPPPIGSEARDMINDVATLEGAFVVHQPKELDQIPNP